MREVFYFLLILQFASQTFSQGVSHGEIDLTDFSFGQKSSVNLSGYWEYYPSALLHSDSPDSIPEAELIRVPKTWSQNGLPSQGFGTYSIKVLVENEGNLGLRIPDVYTAYNLYINGNYIEGKSVAARTREDHTPYRFNKVYSLRHLSSDTLLIHIEVANFLHRRGGLKNSISLGVYDHLAEVDFKKKITDGFVGGCLIMGGFFFLGLFLFGTKEQAALYFALFCIGYAYRIIGWGNFVLHDMIFIPYQLSIRLEYASFYVCGFFFARYIRNLFPKETPKYLVRIFGDFSLLWAGLTLLPIRIFTNLNTAFLVVMLMGIVVIIVIYIRAMIYHRIGASYSIFSTIGIFVVFSTKTMDYFGYLEEPYMVTAAGQLMFFLFQSLILSERFSFSWKMAQLNAEEAARSKSDFLSVMSHEIRTPLNAVIGTTYHLMETNPRDDQLKELKNLKLSSDNLLALINNILDFSKIEAGKIEFDEVAVNFRDFSFNALQIFKNSADKKGLALEFRFDEALPKSVKVDKLRLNQVLSNLLSNAIKFTDSGYVRLKITHESTKGNQVSVRFSVEDTGIGIEEQNQKTIFNAFQQAYGSISRKYGGTGLGLSITKHLVQLMGSELQLSSRLGYGSKFYFTLNLQQVAAEVAPEKKTTNTYDLKGLKILLVEDNEMNIVVATNIMSKWNVNIETALNGLEAIKKVSSRSYDFILMDLQMPEMDGYQATKQIRKMGFTNPILALTASAMLDKSSKLKAAGLDGMVSKPFNPKDLFMAIAERLKLAEAQQ